MIGSNGAGTSHSSGAHDVTPVFGGPPVAQFVVPCVVFWRPLFVIFYFVVRFPFTTFDYLIA